MESNNLETAPPRSLGTMQNSPIGQHIGAGHTPSAIPEVVNDLFKPMGAECSQCCRMRGLGYQTDEIGPHRVFDVKSQPA